MGTKVVSELPVCAIFQLKHALLYATFKLPTTTTTTTTTVVYVFPMCIRETQIFAIDLGMGTSALYSVVLCVKELKNISNAFFRLYIGNNKNEKKNVNVGC